MIEAVVHFEPITDLENYIGNCEFVEYFSDGTIEYSDKSYVSDGNTMTINNNDDLELLECYKY